MRVKGLRISENVREIGGSILYLGELGVRTDEMIADVTKVLDRAVAVKNYEEKKALKLEASTKVIERLREAERIFKA